jgi:hypothetical protein
MRLSFPVTPKASAHNRGAIDVNQESTFSHSANIGSRSSRTSFLARTSRLLDAGITHHRLIWLNAGLSDPSSIASDTSLEACDARDGRNDE